MVNKMATKYEIERFNGSNFSLWKMRIKAILRKDNCLTAIGDRPAEITDNAKWNEMCCYPIFDPCFDKFSEKFKNSEKH